LSYNFNIAFINLCTEAEGPGKRISIWFQGCDINCAGCCNPELQEFKLAHILSLKDLVSIISDAKEKFGIEGVTFLGGEPTLQIGLQDLSNAVQKMGLGVILFTGRIVEELSKELVDAVDIVIDGKFEEKNVETERNLIGSRNQRLLFVTDRYKKNEDWFLIPRPKRIEVNFSEDLFISGDNL